MYHRAAAKNNGGTEEVIALLMSAAPVPAVRSRRPVQTFAENADDEELEEALRPLGPDKGTKRRRRTRVFRTRSGNGSAGGNSGGNAGIDSGDSGDGQSRSRSRSWPRQAHSQSNIRRRKWKSAGKAAVKPKRRAKRQLQPPSLRLVPQVGRRAPTTQLEKINSRKRSKNVRGRYDGDQ